MKAEIITIGDELLLGQITDTNALFISQHLTKIGVEVCRRTTVGDNKDALMKTFRRALSENDVVITTGGLGPTHDDITKNVAAEFFNSQLIFKKEILERIERRFARRGYKMPKVNENQALFPEDALLIPNPVGTAPGIHFENEKSHCFILPGIPFEMKAMMTQTILPLLESASTGEVIDYRMLRTTGIPESALFEKLDNLKEIERFVSVAFLPRFTGVSMRLTSQGKSQSEVQEKIQHAEKLVREKIDKYIYGVDDDTLESVVGKLLQEKGRTIAAAESCSGGLFSHRLTNVSGSSAYFMQGIVTYSNEAKMKLLHVPKETLEKYGAVSEPTAIAMAKSVRETARTDIGVSITGIAGPTGGTPEKPVGLVYIGYADEQQAYANKYQFFKDRVINKEMGTQVVLNLVRKHLLK